MAFKKKVNRLSILLSLLSFTTQTYAFSDFSLPFINASDLGTTYAGWAALAEDASTVFSNPAGLAKIPTYQIVFPMLGLLGGAKFRGTTTTPSFPFPFPDVERGTAESRLHALFPSFYFAAPLSDRLTFGFGQTAPYGLGSDYRKNSIVRHLATKSKIVVVDASPSAALKVTDNFSVGIGVDIQYLMFSLNNKIGRPFFFPFDAEMKNEEYGWGVGWHAGLLYQMTPCFRTGLSYQSRTRFHSGGQSDLFFPFPPEKFTSKDLQTAATLPDRAELSLYYDVHPRLALMGTVFYTHWSVLDKIVLENAVVFGGGKTTIVIPLEYRDTFDYALGLSFRATHKLSLRTGAQYMDTPTNDRFRSVADPIGSAVIVGVGAHYVQNCCVTFDIGYAHSFFIPQPINLQTPLVSAVGRNYAQSNVFGVQMTWNIGYQRFR